MHHPSVVPSPVSVETLAGTVIESVGRAGVTGVVDFAGAEGETFRLRLSCPFRISKGPRILLGSGDLQTRYAGPSGDLAKPFDTVYDLRAVALTGILGAVRPEVSAAGTDDDGSLRLCWGTSYALTAFPAGSGDTPPWLTSRH